MTIKELKERMQLLEEMEIPAIAKGSICNLYQQCIDQIELIKSIVEYNLPDASLYCKDYLNKIGEPHGEETQKSEERSNAT